MSRWEPNARGRLEEAALELYTERGFDETTVAEIAERAGLTERTFFRHFADKREVLFGGQDALLALFVNTIVDAPDSMSPIDAVGAALEAAGPVFEGRHKHGTAATGRHRGQPEPAGTRTDQARVDRLGDRGGLRRRGYRRVRGEADRRGGRRRVQGGLRAMDQRGTDEIELPQFIRESLDELKAMAAGG